MPIDVMPALPGNIVGFVARGEVRPRDYETTVEPAVEQAIALHRRIRLLCIVGSDVEWSASGGVPLGATRGVRHLPHLEMVAIVTDHQQLREGVDRFRHHVPGLVRVFSLADEHRASEWLSVAG